jgi:hypothetical protein
MPGFMPGIHVFFRGQDVDGRASGHRGFHDKMPFQKGRHLDRLAKI